MRWRSTRSPLPTWPRVAVYRRLEPGTGPRRNRCLPLASDFPLSGATGLRQESAPPREEYRAELSASIGFALSAAVASLSTSDMLAGRVRSTRTHFINNVG